MKNFMLIVVAISSLLTISASAFAQVQTNSNSAASPKAESTPSPNRDTESSPLPPDLKERVKAKYEEYASFSWRWSAIYWGSVFGAAILSAFAGIVLKLDALKNKKVFRLSQTDIAALLAGTATLLIAMSSAGDFNGKWKANRTAKNRSEQLSNELYNSKITPEEVVNKLNKIIDDQNNGVINVKDEAKQDTKNKTTP